MTYVKSVLYNFPTVRNHYLNRLEIHKVYHRLHGNVSHLYEVRETSITLHFTCKIARTDQLFKTASPRMFLRFAPQVLVTHKKHLRLA